LLGQGSYQTVFRVDMDVARSSSFPYNTSAETSTNSSSNSGKEVFALKISNYEHDIVERLVDRNRLDALIAERLTRSPNILNIYAYCGTASLYEFASGGSLSEYKTSHDPHLQQWSLDQKLRVAFQVASAVADLHTIDGPHQPASVLHGDIDGTQFVSTNGGQDYKLNDFNGARLLFQDSSSANDEDQYNGHDGAGHHEKSTICKVPPSLFGGYHRAPEDYKEERPSIDEKSDVFSLGNALWTIVTGQTPFHQKRYSKAQELLVQGYRESLPDEHFVVTQGKDENHDSRRLQVFRTVIEQCWVHEPSERPSARQIALMLGKELEKKD